MVLVGMVGWQIGGELSSDAIGMALGVLFGIMAGIPAALMVLAAQRAPHQDEYEQPQRRPQYREIPQQPPVIVVTGQNPYESHPYGSRSTPSWDVEAQYRELPGPRGEQRAFRIIGEEEEPLSPW